MDNVEREFASVTQDGPESIVKHEIVWIEHATVGEVAKMPHACATLVGWVRIVRGAMKLCISVFLIAQDTESSTLTLANANAIPNGLEGIATSLFVAWIVAPMANVWDPHVSVPQNGKAPDVI